MKANDEVVDPADASAATEEARASGRRRYKKLAKGAPGDIRMVNKQGILSQGTRAVIFVDDEFPVGLDDEEAREFVREAEDEGLVEDGALLATAAEQLNLYFSHRANRTLAEVYVSGGGATLLCFIDVFLDGEDLEDFQDISEEVTRAMGERRRQREEAKEKEAAERAAKEAQDKADLELGRKVREHNIIEKARDAEQRLEQIRKAANKLAKKHGEKGWDTDAS